MIVARVIDPRSKLATARGLHPETTLSTLAQELEVEEANEDELYEAMDWLLDRQGPIEAKLAKKHLRDGTLVLYDVSSSYYTGMHCSLAKRGYSRDGRPELPQIVYGLLCNPEGCPIAIEVFAGNVADPKTLSAQILKVRQRFHLKRVVFVADRGLLTSARIRDELEPVEGLDWITALRAPAIRLLVQAGSLQPSLFDERDLAEISSEEYPGERLFACRNSLLAERRRHKREELLKATEKDLDEIIAATRRGKRTLRGKDKIALRVGRIRDRHKMGKHFVFTITETTFSYSRDQAKIDAEAALDGIYIVRTSVPPSVFDGTATVRTYKSLALVERAFRSLKTVDLKVRPIFHRRAGRVRAHVFLCMLAYYVEWHMRQALAPMLFDDEDKDLAQSLRDSIVAPAKRSPSAVAKAATKQTSDGKPVHSFQTLIEDLATLTKVRYRPRNLQLSSPEQADFTVVTTPTPVQRRALDCLGVSLTA
jgi:transposase